MDLMLWYLTHNNPMAVPLKWGYHQGDECPRCGSRCHDESEMVDVGVGSVAVTYDMYCLICGLEGHNSGQDVVWIDYDEHGNIVEFKEPGFIIKVDDKYFGYDNDPAYPETLYEDEKKAYEFKSEKSIKELLTWWPHKSYEIIPVNQ